MHKNWKTLSSKEVFNHPRLKLVEDEVLLPNGSKTSYLKFKDKPDANTIICRREDGKILLCLEYCYPLNKAIYMFPGGGILAGEDLQESANRELMEEAGLKAGLMTFLGKYFINQRRSPATMYVYLGEDLTEESLPRDSEEEIEISWHAEDEIEKMILDGKIENSQALAAWTLYKLKKEKHS